MYLFQPFDLNCGVGSWAESACNLVSTHPRRELVPEEGNSERVSESAKNTAARSGLPKLPKRGFRGNFRGCRPCRARSAQNCASSKFLHRTFFASQKKPPLNRTRAASFDDASRPVVSESGPTAEHTQQVAAGQNRARVDLGPSPFGVKQRATGISLHVTSHDVHVGSPSNDAISHRPSAQGHTGGLAPVLELVSFGLRANRAAAQRLLGEARCIVPLGLALGSGPDSPHRRRPVRGGARSRATRRCAALLAPRSCVDPNKHG